MPSTIITKNGSGAPLAADLVAGELAVDLTNGRLYTDDGSSVIEIGLNPSGNVDVTGTVTADGLTVDGNPIINGTSPQLFFQTGASNYNWQLAAQENVSDAFEISSGAADASAPDDTYTKRLVIQNTGDISFYEDTGTTAKFFWDASAESLGIGTSSPTGLLTLGTGTFSAAAANTSALYTSTTAGLVAVADGFLLVDRAGADVFKVDTDGNLLVGSTTLDQANNSNTANCGINLLESGIVSGSTNNATTAYFNRLAGDGEIVSFRKDGAPVGSIGSASGVSVYIHGGTGYSGLTFGNDELNPCDETGANRDAQIDLGDSLARFKDLYLSGKTYLNTSSGAQLVLQTDATRGFIGTSTSHDLVLETAGSEAARLDSNQNLLVGTTSLTAIDGTPTTTGIGLRSTGSQLHSVNNGGNAFEFRINGTAGTVGSISCSGSTTTYNTSSDQRLKENIVDAPSASDDIDAIQVRSFDWKVNGSHQKYGMIAQELQTVAPEAVSAPEDPDEMMGVDYSKLVPMMLKEIQSLRARVAQLEGAN